MRSYFQLFIVLIMLPISLLSQNVNNTWYFGNQAGLSFTTNPPTALTGPLQAVEGSATISDPAGNLLFYSNGMTIWDRNHNIMPNGNGLSGGISSTQPALIVPLPGSCSKYYLFTADDQNGTGYLRYSIVNMCLHNGFGDIETLTKNTLLTQPVGEKITSVKHSNGTDIWIITHKLSSNQFLAFLLTPAGLNSSPVISTLGTVHSSSAMIGPIKTSHNGLKLVTSASFANICEMFDFNPTNGQVSNFVNLTQQYSLPSGVYGIEFSPNDSLLYISTFWGINYLFQLNIYTSVKTTLSSISGNYTFGALQIGENQKIYMARGNQNFLSVINNPNLPGLACNYIAYGQALAIGTMSNMGLINPSLFSFFTPQQQSLSLGNDTIFCYSDSLSINLTKECSTTFLWQNLSTDSFFIITQPGTYWVQVSNSCFTFSDTIQVAFGTFPVIDLGNDTTLCQGNVLILDATTINASSYLWQNNSTNPTYTVTNSGTYWVEVTDSNGCSNSDTIIINFSPSSVVNLGNDTTLCQGNVLILDATILNATSYLWQNNSTNPTYTVTNSGTYWVEVTDSNGCSNSDTIIINFGPSSVVNLGNDTTLCQGNVLILDATTLNATSYLWQNNSTNPTYTVTNSGTYWVEVTNTCGRASDTLTIAFENCDCFLYIPNAFTPNKDNINDKFAPLSNCDFSEYNFLIYNRWGEKIFETKNSYDSWDGTYNGKKSPIGVYVFLVIYKFQHAGRLQKCGKVVLTR